MLFLQWFRDKGLGQEAAEAFDAHCGFWNGWPVARLYFEHHSDTTEKWKEIYAKFKVNAMTWDTSVCVHCN